MSRNGHEALWSFSRFPLALGGTYLLFTIALQLIRIAAALERAYPAPTVPK